MNLRDRIGRHKKFPNINNHTILDAMVDAGLAINWMSQIG